MKQSNVRRFGSCALVALFTALPVAHALAQPSDQRPVARLKQVNGNVLVSRESGLSTANEAQPLTNGSRVITTANSDVIVVFDNGCEVTLKQNERFEVDSLQPCALLQAQSLLPPVAAVAPPIQGVLVPITSGILLLGEDLGILSKPVSVNVQSVSPN